MGCDIHCFVEYKDKKNNWQPADAWVQDDKWGEGMKWRVPSHLQPYGDRNYNFFAWLADVRNGTWGEEIPPLAQPKGLPDDCSERIRADSDGWGADGHSHSYFTLRELEEGWKATKDIRILFNGALDPRNPNAKLKVWLDTPEDKRGAPPCGFCAYGTNCMPFRWYQPLSELIGEAYRELHKYMWNVGFEFMVEDSADNVRVVFWFDN